MIYKTYYKSEVGVLEIAGDALSILSINFVETTGEPSSQNLPHLEATVQQLHEYFEGKRQVFELNLQPQGTAFQRQVWEALQNVPYGQTVSYNRIAQDIGNLKAVRAVGHANGQNPIAIIIPCHRIIGSNGKMTGYAGGLWRKTWLLKHENCLML